MGGVKTDMSVCFLRYYLITFRMKSMVVNIRQIAPLPRIHVPYGNRRLTIEGMAVHRNI